MHGPLAEIFNYNPCTEYFDPNCPGVSILVRVFFLFSMQTKNRFAIEANFQINLLIFTNNGMSLCAFISIASTFLKKESQHLHLHLHNLRLITDINGHTLVKKVVIFLWKTLLGTNCHSRNCTNNAFTTIIH